MLEDIQHAVDDWVSGQQARALRSYYARYPEQVGAGKLLGIYFFFERTGVGFNAQGYEDMQVSQPW